MLKPQPPARMTSDEFLEWAALQSDVKLELHGGSVVSMAGETRLHGFVKKNVLNALGDLAAPCESYVDGVAIKVNEDTTFIPDIFVDCGDQDDFDSMTADEPVIVIEVLSDSTWRYDIGVKVDGYFSVPTIQHYLLVDGHDRRIVYHYRDGDDITTRILTTGDLTLAPPGITIQIEDFWRGLPPPTDTQGTA